MDFHHESMMSVTLDDFILSANEQLSGFSAIHRELNGWHPCSIGANPSSGLILRPMVWLGKGCFFCSRGKCYHTLEKTTYIYNIEVQVLKKRRPLADANMG